MVRGCIVTNVIDAHPRVHTRAVFTVEPCHEVCLRCFVPAISSFDRFPPSSFRCCYSFTLLLCCIVVPGGGSRGASAGNGGVQVPLPQQERGDGVERAELLLPMRKRGRDARAERESREEF